MGELNIYIYKCNLANLIVSAIQTYYTTWCVILYDSGTRSDKWRK